MKKVYVEDNDLCLKISDKLKGNQMWLNLTLVGTVLHWKSRSICRTAPGNLPWNTHPYNNPYCDTSRLTLSNSTGYSLSVYVQTKLYCEAKAKCGQLEEALAELEKTAKQQLHGLATQSEAAIDAAQEQLTNSHMRIQQYQLFVKVSHAVPAVCQGELYCARCL